MDALIVGAGGSGFLHALALRSAGVRIAAVVDPDAERAAWLADLTGADVVTDPRRVDSDVVAICSPPRHHVAQAEHLARPGRITFVEKPVALGRRELGRLARLPGVVPVLQWRAGRSAHELRAAFAGARAEVRCAMHLRRDAEYFARREDWGCGPLLSIGIHAVDLVVWVVGRSATQAAVRASSATEAALDVVFEGGTRASFRITLDGTGPDTLRLTFSSARCSATLLASEQDPTASPLRWWGSAAPSNVTGATGSPLLVPFVHDALAGRGPSVSDVALAHELAFASESDGAAGGRICYTRVR